MRQETLFEPGRDLIIVDAVLCGPLGEAVGRLLLDTGNTITTIVPELVERVGYSQSDAFRRTTVTALGTEHGYALRVTALSSC